MRATEGAGGQFHRSGLPGANCLLLAHKVTSTKIESKHLETWM